jgi:hypothetical protein
VYGLSSETSGFAAARATRPSATSAAGLGLEEQVDGAFAGLMAALGPAFFRFAVSHG